MTTSNRFEVITACAPDTACPICQEGRKRYRHTLRNPKGAVVTFEHIVKTENGAYKLDLCAVQRGPKVDLTKSF